MAVLWMLQSESLKQLDMQRYRSKPFFSSNHVCRSHQVIIYQMRKMIGWQAIRFNQDRIIVIICHRNFSFDHIIKRYFGVHITMRSESNHRWLTNFELLDNFFRRFISPHRVITIDACRLFRFFLHGSNRIHFFSTHPTRISLTFCNQVLHKGVI